MKVNGQLWMCERCGKTVFLKCTGEGERDGGYTRWNTFEPAPKGWKEVGVYHRGIYLVCPECYEEYQKFMEEVVDPFMKGYVKEKK